MIELPLIMLAGLLGSGHCIGMCGPLALTLGAGARLKTNLQRQLVYSAGRIFTYAFCGAVAAFAGVWLAAHTRSLVVSQAWLALGAGGLLVLVGLASVGLLPRPAIRLFGRAPCGAASAVKTLLTASPLSSVFLAGAATGFIPCGLVYAFLLKAGSTGSPGQGALVMAAFGIGTVPLMVAVGAGGSLLTLTARTRMLRIAGWCVVLTGCVTMVRGAGQLNPPTGAATAPCPLCAATEAE
jgi:sulfite exporter TauE/SafE